MTEYPDIRVQQGKQGSVRLIGMVRQPDPAAVPDTAAWELINGRIVGGRWVNRGGQAKVNTGGTTDGCPELIFDAGDIGARNPGELALPPEPGLYMGAMDGTEDGDIAETITSFDAVTDSFSAVTNTAVGHIRGWANLNDGCYVVVGPQDSDSSTLTTDGLVIRKATSLSLSAAEFVDVATYGTGQDGTSGPLWIAAFDGDLFVGFWDDEVFPAVYSVIKSDGVSTASVDKTWTSPDPRLIPSPGIVFDAEDSLLVLANTTVGSDEAVSFNTRSTSGVWSEVTTGGMTSANGSTDLSIVDYYISTRGTHLPVEFDSKMFVLARFTNGLTIVPVMLTFAGGVITNDQEFAGYEVQVPATVFNGCLYFFLLRSSDSHYLLCKRTVGGVYTLGEYDLGTGSGASPAGIFSSGTNLYIIKGESGGSVPALKSSGTDTTAFSSVDTFPFSGNAASSGLYFA